MKASILVTGGTGRLGRLVVAGLRARGADFRVLTRDAARAAQILGPEVALMQGDLAGADLGGFSRIFLLSPIAPDIVEQQTGVLRRAGAARVLKLSGSDWTLGASWSGNAHQAIEAALRPGDLAVRPSVWTQGALASMVAQLAQGDSFASSHGPIAYIDTRDIADAVVTLLLADSWPSAPPVITGPRALDREALAAIAADITGRRIRGLALDLADQATQLAASGASPFVQRYRGDFARLMHSGVAATVTDTLPGIIGRPPRDVADYLCEVL
jgi:uncharacterized protein YbjT (DUF2867 family)